MGTSRAENSAQGLSCVLKFVHNANGLGTTEDNDKFRIYKDEIILEKYFYYIQLLINKYSHRFQAKLSFPLPP
jgi:hypothetical protein